MLEINEKVAKPLRGLNFSKGAMFGFGKQSRLNEFCWKIVNSMEEAVLVVDDNHIVIFCNEGARQMFGYEEDELIGKGLGSLIPKVGNFGGDTILKAFKPDVLPPSSKTGPSDSADKIEGMRKDGTEFGTSVAMMDVSSETERFYAAIVRDISEDQKTEEELLRLASTDPLTGAFNRREFKSLAEQEGMRSQRYGRPLSIMMLDIDHFKNLNDTYGHAAGDKALQHFVNTCMATLRNMDIFGRWGGEEFVVLLPETDIQGGGIIAERLREAIEKSEFSHGGNKIDITVSIGVAQYKTGEIATDAPLARADVAIYNAKKSGRNQVCIADD